MAVLCRRHDGEYALQGKDLKSLKVKGGVFPRYRTVRRTRLFAVAKREINSGIAASEKLDTHGRLGDRLGRLANIWGVRLMSALPLKAEITQSSWNVR